MSKKPTSTRNNLVATGTALNKQAAESAPKDEKEKQEKSPPRKNIPTTKQTDSKLKTHTTIDNDTIPELQETVLSIEALEQEQQNRI